MQGDRRYVHQNTVCGIWCRLLVYPLHQWLGPASTCPGTPPQGISLAATMTSPRCDYGSYNASILARCQLKSSAREEPIGPTDARDGSVCVAVAGRRRPVAQMATK